MIKKINIRLVITLMALLLLGIECSANLYATTKVTTAYEYVLKDGNTVYCCAGRGLYRVNLKTHKIKRLEDVGNPVGDCLCYSMQKSGKYIYYIMDRSGIYVELRRTKCTGGKSQCIAGKNKKSTSIQVREYAIVGSKIYCYYEKCFYKKDKDIYKNYTEVMKKNGKSKKKVDVKIKIRYKPTNAKGYKVVNKEKGSDVYAYLITPKESIYLEKFKW